MASVSIHCYLDSMYFVHLLEGNFFYIIVNHRGLVKYSYLLNIIINYVYLNYVI